MSKPSHVALRAVLAAVSFWLGSLPMGICAVAYDAFWVGEGPEGAPGFFLAGTFLWGLFCAVLALAFFLAIFLAIMLSRKTATDHDWRLYVFSGVLGLFCSCLVLGLAWFGT